MSWVWRATAEEARSSTEVEHRIVEGLVASSEADPKGMDQPMGQSTEPEEAHKDHSTEQANSAPVVASTSQPWNSAIPILSSHSSPQ